MATKKKMLQAAAGNAGGAGEPGLDVAEVFSTYLYTGNGSTQTITNGIDLDGEGGLVWLKSRSAVQAHGLFDTERTNGTYKFLQSSSTAADIIDFGGASGGITPSSNGFTRTSASYFGGTGDGTGSDYASWTFRKAPKFFDVVTWTGDGDGTSDRVINHNLGVAPGVVIIKATSVAGNWWFTHRLVGTDGGSNLSMRLNTTDAATDYGIRASTDSPTTFTLRGTNSAYYANNNGVQYVAYLFAHNDGDGEFGPDGDADIIKCGSFTTDGSGNFSADLGFEPQWIIVKNASGSDNWLMLDTMRGWTTEFKGQRLRADLSNAEATGAFIMSPTSTGFFGSGGGLATNSDYIYMAIRRGPLAQPESGTEVFVPAVTGLNTSGTSFPATFTPDYLLASYGTTGSGDNWYGIDRMRGGTSLSTNTTDAETSPVNSNYNLRFDGGMSGNWTGYVAWMWKRAPGFFDVVAYKGDAVAGRTVSHNLGVAPEMIWVKKRNAARSWIAYHSGIGSGKFLELDNTSAAGTVSTVWYDTDPTSTNFTVGTNSSVNQVPDTYIAYLFATVPGVSKVGSYTGNGTSQTIDCGFTTGARFILIKRTDASGDWWVLDTERGIVAGNDALLNLNTTSAEVTSVDVIDPNSSGFTVDTTNSDFNASGGSYIFYAIA